MRLGGQRREVVVIFEVRAFQLFVLKLKCHQELYTHQCRQACTCGAGGSGALERTHMHQERVSGAGASQGSITATTRLRAHNTQNQ